MAIAAVLVRHQICNRNSLLRLADDYHLSLRHPHISWLFQVVKRRRRIVYLVVQNSLLLQWKHLWHNHRSDLVRNDLWYLALPIKRPVRGLICQRGVKGLIYQRLVVRRDAWHRHRRRLLLEHSLSIQWCLLVLWLLDLKRVGQRRVA